jgi:hypothetical protein
VVLAFGARALKKANPARVRRAGKPVQKTDSHGFTASMFRIGKKSHGQYAE